jgi:asparagine N-glycosylation enzyme membrane subunit Stt3
MSSPDQPASDDGPRDENRTGLAAVGPSIRSRVGTALRRRRTVALGVALSFVAAIRLLPVPAVYRGSDVVLSSNDPYLYRYWVDRLLAEAAHPLDLGVLTALPDGSSVGEPLLVATMWWVSELFGGSEWVTGTVLAWYPVVSAVVTGAVVYLLAVELSDDARVGLAAVGLFAVVPGHAFRTGLGFADHHAFDYVWLAMTALCLLVVVAERETRWPWSRRTVAASGCLAIAVVGQVFAWEAGPLLLVPLAVAIAMYAPFAVHKDAVGSLTALTVALGLAAALSLAIHAELGWQTTVVAATPALLFLGCAGLLSGAVLVTWSRIPAPAVSLTALELVGAAAAVVVVPRQFPELLTALERGISFLQRSSGIAEMQSITAEWGPVFGPLIMLGFVPFLAVPVLIYSVWHAFNARDPRWLLLSSYAWTFLGLAFVQRRFTGEVAPFAAVFAGFAFVWLGSLLDLNRSPAVFRTATGTGRVDAAADGGDERIDARPDSPETESEDEATLALPGRRRLLLLGSLGAVFTGFPALYTAAIHPRVTIDSRKHEAAAWMAEYAAERDLTYPQNYVFSEWGRNRMYNYFVSGESRSYGFARRNYADFLYSNRPGEWYETLRERAGFLVTTREVNTRGQRIHDRLHGSLGSRNGDVSGVAHYRAVYASDDGFLNVFTLVPGATLVGTASPQEPVVLTTTVSIPGTTFEYERRTVTDAEGRFSVTVPHPGEYQVGDERITVPERAVLDGEAVTVD